MTTSPLPIARDRILPAHHRTIMTPPLPVTPREGVEVGSGSGYQSAVRREVVPQGWWSPSSGPLLLAVRAESTLLEQELRT